MPKLTDLKELEENFFVIMEWQDEQLTEIDRKIENIGEVLRRTEYKIKHFGEAWPDNV